MTTMLVIFFVLLFVVLIVALMRNSAMYHPFDSYDDEVTTTTTTTTTTVIDTPAVAAPAVSVNTGLNINGFPIVGMINRQFEGATPFVLDPVDGQKCYLNTTDDLYEDANGKWWGVQ